MKRPLAPSRSLRRPVSMMIAGPGTRLTVAVEAPTTTHVLTVAKLQSWLDTNGKTPREQAAKVTLRQLLRRE
jgi:hypothetical protein